MGQQAIAKRNFVDDHLEKLFTAAVQRSIEVKGNVLALAQWLVNSVTMENLLPIYGNLRYDDIYGRKKAVTTRFRVSNRHGVIICLTKLLELRMAKESQTRSHIFMDQIRSWMLRLRTHLTAGGFDLVSVLEIMVLINGLPKQGGWSVLAMSLSTDETLSFGSMCEKLQQQADRLSTDRGARAPPPGNNSSGHGNGIAKMITGGGGGTGGSSASAGGSSGNGGGKPYVPYKPKTYWNGQNSKPTYQKFQTESDDVQSQSSDRSNDKKKSVKFDEKKSYLNKKKGKDKGGGGKSPAHGKSVKSHRNDYNDEEECGFIFKVFGEEEESSESAQLGVSLSTSSYRNDIDVIQSWDAVYVTESSVVSDKEIAAFLSNDSLSTSGYMAETEEVSLPKSSVVLTDSLTKDIFTPFLDDDGTDKIVETWMRQKQLFDKEVSIHDTLDYFVDETDDGIEIQSDITMTVQY